MNISVIIIMLCCSILIWATFNYMQYRHRRWNGLADLHHFLNAPHNRPNQIPRDVLQRNLIRPRQNESADAHLKRELQAMPSVVGRAILSWRELEEKEEQDAEREIRHDRAKQLVGRMVNTTANEKEAQARELVLRLLNGNGKPTQKNQDAAMAVAYLLERRR